MLIKQSGTSGTTKMDVMVLTSQGENINGLRYENITNNFFAGIDRLGDNRALVYNTSANLPNSIGGVDNFVNVIDVADLPGSASCISSIISGKNSVVPYDIEEVNIKRGELHIKVEEIVKKISAPIISRETCCNCTQVKACFTTCNISCLDCANVFINCSSASDCGNLSDVENPYTWEVTNIATNAVFTSNEKDYLFIPPGVGNSSYKVCLTVTDSEGCSNTYCEVVDYNCNGTLVKEEVSEFDLGGILDKEDIEIFRENQFPEKNTKKSQSVLLQPNPAQTEVTLDWGDEELIGSDILIYNTSGQLNLQERINSIEKVTLNIEQLPVGIYIIKIVRKGKSVEEQKLIINR